MSTGKLAKTIILTAQSSEIHTAVKIKNVLKWLKSGHEVRVSINGKKDRQKAMEELTKRIEDEAKMGAKLLQRVVKPESIKFVLKPTEKASEIIIPDTKEEEGEESIDDIVSGKDILSDEFQEELERSIRKESLKPRRK